MIISDFPANSLKFSHLSSTVVVVSVLVLSRLGCTELWFHNTAIPHTIKGKARLSEKTDTFQDKRTPEAGFPLFYLAVHEAVQG